MKKRIFAIFLLVAILSTAASCAQKQPDAKTSVVVAGLRGPTSMGMIRLFEEQSLNSDSYTVEYIAESAPDALTAKIINNEIQIAAVPTNLASVLYNKTEGEIQFLALNTLGVIHIVGSLDIDKLSDLKGETLHISGKGATPDYAVSYMLQSLGLSDDIELVFYPDHASLAQAVIAGDAKAAVLPQPFVTQVTMQSEQIRLLVDLNQEWETITKGSSVLSMGCLIVNKDFAENNRNFILDFLKEYEESVNWVNTNTGEAGILIAKHGILPSSDLAQASIPSSAIVYQSAQDSKSEVENFLQILMDYNPSSIGGKLPDENFYFK
ncbi:MAG: ABC transporter substrate-binding protein [Eubacteriales bacterium]|nr:ABC transporter substrate-binding protein [Eubacteriales bacterium]